MKHGLPTVFSRLKLASKGANLGMLEKQDILGSLDDACLRHSKPVSITVRLRKHDRGRNTNEQLDQLYDWLVGCYSQETQINACQHCSNETLLSSRGERFQLFVRPLVQTRKQKDKDT